MSKQEVNSGDKDGSGSVQKGPEGKDPLEYTTIIREYFQLKNCNRNLKLDMDQTRLRMRILENAISLDDTFVAVLDKSRDLLLASESLLSALGGKAAVKKTLKQLVAQISQAELLGRPVEFETTFRREDAAEESLRGVISLLGSSVKQNGFLVKFFSAQRGAPEKEIVEEDEDLRRKMTETIQLLQAAFISDAPVGALFKNVLDKLLGLSGSQFGFVGRVLHTPNGAPYLKTHAISDISWNETTRELFKKISTEGMEFRNLNTLFGHTLKTGQVVISNNPKTDPRSGGLPEGHPPLDNFLGVPFTLGGRMVGMAGLANRPGGFDEKLVMFLRPLLVTCASLLDAYQNKEEKRRAEDGLVRAKMAAEKAIRDKDKYISLIAHDLKSPFTSIIAFLKLLGKGKISLLDLDNRPLFDSIIESSERATKMIDEVLSLSRLGIGAVKLCPRYIDAQAAAHSAISLMGHIAQGKEMRVINKIPLGTRIYADSALFGEVLANLLSNAIKFTERGGEVVFFTPMGQPTTVAIRDNGVGIADEMLPKIFRHDLKTTTEGTEGEKGTGLALPLCREILRAHKGDLSVESSRGGGSVFYARLPERRPKVLVVDDQPIARKKIRMLLAPTNAEVLEVESATEAMSRAVAQPPDLICLDLNMPGVDGYEVLETLKRSQDTSAFPIIVITSDDRVETREKAIRLGADDFITKKVLESELLPRARKFII
ncbi:MAG: response regulator [Nitrospinota bacterium]|nr:response regulator [Nitrospinota bacterium]